MDDNDDGARVGLWVVLGIITLLLFGLVGGLAMRSLHGKQDAHRATTGDETLIDAPLSGVIVARVYFDVDKSGLHPDAVTGLAATARALADAPGKTLVVAGFHDPSGDPARNAELAKRRAKAVRAALISQGADAARVLLRKPEQTAVGGPPEEARRVEVRLAG